MIDAHDFASGLAAFVALVSAGISVGFARKARRLEAELREPETLAGHARIGIAYAEQLGGSSRQKLLSAVGASIMSDKGKNGRQDWTEAQHRVAIEAELRKLSEALPR